MSIRAPYVGLDYFLEEDAGLFFGRDAARKRIIGNLRASRLTLLYAESGVGKSSLLRAGVSARLRQLAARRASGAREADLTMMTVMTDPRDQKRQDARDARRPRGICSSRASRKSVSGNSSSDQPIFLSWRLWRPGG